MGIQKLNLRCSKNFAFIHIYSVVSRTLLSVKGKEAWLRDRHALCVCVCVCVCVCMCVCVCVCVSIETFEPVGRYSIVSTASRYGLDGPGIKSQLGQDFPHPSRPALKPTQRHIKWIHGHSRGGGEAVGAWRWPHTPFVGDVKERVELPLLPLWAFMTCYRMNFSLPLSSPVYRLLRYFIWNLCH